MSSKQRTNGKSCKRPSSMDKSTDQHVDFSHIRTPINTSLFGLRQVMKLMETATKEVKDYIQYECELIYECRICRTLFRSFANFILHKREYCVKKYIGFDGKQVENHPQKVILCNDSSAPDSSDKCNITPNLINGDMDLALQNIHSDNSVDCIGVFQTLINKQTDNQELIKNEVMEIHSILSDNEAILGPDGKIIEKPTSGFHLTCGKCNLRFATKKMFAQHSKYKHDTLKYVYQCPESDCSSDGKCFPNAWSVYRHLGKVHHKTATQIKRLRGQVQATLILEKDIKVVDKMPATLKHLEGHEPLEWIDKLEGEKQLQACNNCGKCFERRAALNSHVQICLKRSGKHDDSAVGSFKRKKALAKSCKLAAHNKKFKASVPIQPLPPKEYNNESSDVVIVNKDYKPPPTGTVDLIDDALESRSESNSSELNAPNVDLLTDAKAAAAVKSKYINELKVKAKKHKKSKAKLAKLNRMNMTPSSTLPARKSTQIITPMNDESAAQRPRKKSITVAPSNIPIAQLGISVVETSAPIMLTESVTISKIDAIATRPPSAAGTCTTVTHDNNNVCEILSVEAPIKMLDVEELIKCAEVVVKNDSNVTPTLEQLPEINLIKQTDQEIITIDLEAETSNDRSNDAPDDDFVIYCFNEDECDDSMTLFAKSDRYINLNDLECMPCKMKCPNRAKLMQHMSLHFKWFNYRCTLCDFKSYDVKTCNQHVVESHDGVVDASKEVAFIPPKQAFQASCDFQLLSFDCCNNNEDVMSYYNVVNNQAKANVNDPSVQKMIMEVIFGSGDNRLQRPVRNRIATKSDDYVYGRDSLRSKLRTYTRKKPKND